jgi:hypothetical protein
MALGTALSELRYQLKVETYNSLLPAHTVSSTDLFNGILARTQKELWNLYVWPHLKYHIDVPLAAQLRYLDFPVSMPFENVVKIWYQQQPSPIQWFPMEYGFDNSIFTYGGSEDTISWPPRLWRNVVTVDGSTGLTDFDGQMEIWPIPSQATTLRLEGQAPLNPLKVDTDTCMIDDTAIILLAAAEMLGSQKSPVSQMKLTKAQAYIRRLLGKSGANKRNPSALGQGSSYNGGRYKPTPYLDYVPG